jgi:O-antigen ligase
MHDVPFWRSCWVPLCLFLTSAIALVIPSGYSYGFYGLSFAGLIMWMFVRNQLIDSEARAFLIPVLFYAVGQLALGLFQQPSWRSVDLVAPFFLMIFAFLLLRKGKPSAEWFWSGLAVGAIGAACFSGYQALGLGLRAGGYLHPIQFGNIALLLGVVCMVRALVKLEFSWMNILMWIGFVSGVVASVWSQTRGGWVAILLIFFWIYIHATDKWTWLRRISTVFVLFVSMGILSAQFGLSKVVHSRVSDAIIETVAYIENNNQDSPVGSRLAMWQFALQHIGDAPLLGVGKEGWIDLRDQGIADGQLSAVFISQLTHLHNEYLDSVIKRGLVGLGLLLVLYLGPMIYFFRPYMNTINVEVKSLAMVGMVIPMMFMDFGLTQVFLSHNSGRMVLVSLWVCAAALMLNAVEDNQVHEPS